jgi:hypothetical protein
LFQCPKCDGEIDALVAVPWGEPPQEPLRLAPYLCGWCASLLIVDLDRQQLLSPEEVSRVAGVDVIAAMQSNAALWHAITEGRGRILALPDRRKARGP